MIDFQEHHKFNIIVVVVGVHGINTQNNDHGLKRIYSGPNIYINSNINHTLIDISIKLVQWQVQDYNKLICMLGSYDIIIW